MTVPEILNDCLSDLTRVPTAARVVEVPLVWLKILRPLGYELRLFHTAAEALRQRVAKARLTPELNIFLPPWLPESTQPWPEGRFRLLLGESGTGCQLLGASTPDLIAPHWAALLHLPALRGHWQSHLRAAHGEHLRERWPQAWLLDPTPLPPGAVIAGLGITGWDQLRETGADYAIHVAAGKVTPLAAGEPASAWQEKLVHAQQRPGAVLSRIQAPEAWFLAEYAMQENQILLQQAWKADADGLGRVC